MESTDFVAEETLVEMAYRWGDIEAALPGWVRTSKVPEAEDEPLGAALADAIAGAFRVEARVETGEDDYGNPWRTFFYDLFFNVEDHDARTAARPVRATAARLLRCARAPSRRAR